MKLLTLKNADNKHPAVLIGEEVLDLILARKTIASANQVPDSVKSIIAGGEKSLALVQNIIDQASSADIIDKLRENGALTAFESAILGPVIPDPLILLSGSMNSYEHVKEMGDPPPAKPCAFHKAHSAISASGDDIILPPDHGEMVDWEGEFCVVIGKKCHRVSDQEAIDYIAGYTLLNDVSAREFAIEFKNSGPEVGDVCQAWERNVLGKSYPTFAPIGPVMVTADEMPWPLTYHMETLVNGEVMQSSTQEDLVFNPAQMISYFSQTLIFEPGDIISMGSPPGVGMARKPPIFMKPGDVIEVRSNPIGTLRNVVSASS